MSTRSSRAPAAARSSIAWPSGCGSHGRSAARCGSSCAPAATSRTTTGSTRRRRRYRSCARRSSCGRTCSRARSPGWRSPASANATRPTTSACRSSSGRVRTPACRRAQRPARVRPRPGRRAAGGRHGGVRDLAPVHGVRQVAADRRGRRRRRGHRRGADVVLERALRLRAARQQPRGPCRASRPESGVGSGAGETTRPGSGASVGSDEAGRLRDLAGVVGGYGVALKARCLARGRVSGALLVPVEVARRALLEPQAVVLGRLLEEVRRLLQDVLARSSSPAGAGGRAPPRPAPRRARPRATRWPRGRGSGGGAPAAGSAASTASTSNGSRGAGQARVARRAPPQPARAPDEVLDGRLGGRRDPRPVPRRRDGRLGSRLRLARLRPGASAAPLGGLARARELGAARGTERLVLLPRDLLRIRTVLALELKMLADCVVEQSHAVGPTGYSPEATP